MEPWYPVVNEALCTRKWGKYLKERAGELHAMLKGEELHLVHCHSPILQPVRTQQVCSFPEANHSDIQPMPICNDWQDMSLQHEQLGPALDAATSLSFLHGRMRPCKIICSTLTHHDYSCSIQPGEQRTDGASTHVGSAIQN